MLGVKNSSAYTHSLSVSKSIVPDSLSALADGSYTLSATSTDRAGNIGATVSRTWTVDTDPPTTTLTGCAGSGFATTCFGDSTGDYASNA